MSTIYRNQRFRSGNTVSILYNPYITVDTGTFIHIGIGATFDTITYTYTGAAYPVATDIVTCSSFGGIASGSKTGAYSSDYESTSYDTAGGSYGVGGVGIAVPKDCFNGLQESYLTTGYKDKIYAFDATTSIVEDVFISEYLSFTEYGKYGKYPVNYRMNDDNRIKVIVPESEFDVMCQIMMSDTIAIVSCDDTMSASPNIPIGLIQSYPYGGGSFNPIVRQGVVMTKSLKQVRGVHSYELEIKLLG